MTKVLIATKKSQGQRRNDFNWCENGELVGWGAECHGERIDGKCGCRRALIGLDSRKATTTFEVVERDITEDEYADLFLESMTRAGFDQSCTDDCLAVRTDAYGLLRNVAACFPVGSVLERRGCKWSLRE